MTIDRREFLKSVAATAALAGTAAHAQMPHVSEDRIAIPDDGWSLWIDRHAAWQDDDLFLPDDVDLARLPANPPTDGWPALYARHSGPDFATVTLPTTVEQHFWGNYGSRPYTPEEYRYAADDPVPQNGAYTGVSWWWRTIEIPADLRDRRLFLHIRGARMRAEVYLNERLVGYSIMEELPFECDLTSAIRPGGRNILAIRITNPGGRYDWVDGTTIRWGKVSLYRSHGFGGLDRELTLHIAPHACRIADAWVLNTPEPRTIHAFAKIEGHTTAVPRFEVLDPATGKVLATATGESDSGQQTFRATLACPDAHLWDLDTPTLYRLRVILPAANSQHDLRIVPFGFRWFAPDGLGSNAVFRLNGRRIKIFTSISWGYWGHNGLWPTPDLAEREVTQAKRLGLNCLNFHRNVGKEDVFRAHDRLGLLRYMEPGGGKLAIGKL
ncbi:MAG TPA: twin-arginine translocation signal domain-containing protein, partial [Acidobacteriaceae bacterium]|nr:twin-arginine translocation signal domain-containing protein [Acidobacteriaceae bacterium]